ncbi:TetR/AcrR family transcriptional regulator [Pseudomonas sp. RGM2987]|uniref:TetR/AcrR family transcriptional regulator n=1 Tax=Pseudomonas sp. RGM2987 TaxID=2930090 RepID=UPI001FD6FB28|nr:TetR/AcrR family transcriptional regulator [Pseudomonas sp. RGM2987]MCJ8207968.1 TetR/AcrR family transcriptional regulator [Pseudomonas sp. RGM2987]
MTLPQSVTHRGVSSRPVMTISVDAERQSRFVETRLKALELFARHGFSRVGMRDLATGMGIKPGSIYNHIESKETLLFELIEELYEQLLDGAGRVTRRKTAPEVRLRSLLEAHLLLHERMGAHFRLAEYDLHCLNEEQQGLILSLRRRYEEYLIHTIEQLTGKPTSVARRAALSGVVSLLNQLPAWVAELQVNQEARRKLLHDMVMGSLQGALQATLENL